MNIKLAGIAQGLGASPCKLRVLELSFASFAVNPSLVQGHYCTAWLKSLPHNLREGRFSWRATLISS